MRRGRAGIGALQGRVQTRERFKEEGEKLTNAELERVEAEMALFKSHLQAFALKHKKSIQQDPLFRHQFTEMCRSLGVDPLSSSKGFWTEYLGVGTFYYELGVQVIEICLQTRDVNGGLLELDSLLTLVRDKRSSVPSSKSSRPNSSQAVRSPSLSTLKDGGNVSPQGKYPIIDESNKKRSNRTDVSAEDIEKCISKLKILGEGFKIVKVGGKKLIQSVPMQLSDDHFKLLELAQERGYLSEAIVMESLMWSRERFQFAMHIPLSEGHFWVDNQAGLTDSLPTGHDPAFYWLSSRLRVN